MKSIYTLFCSLIFGCLFCQEVRVNPNLKPAENQINNNESVQNHSTQETIQKSKNNPWRFGGNLGLSFGSITNIAIQPRIGYQFNQYLLGGINIGYLYSSTNSYNINYKTNLFNAGIFLQPTIKNIFAIIDYEYYTGTRKYNQFFSDDKISEQALWLGAGYQIKLGNNAYSSFGFQYTLSKQVFGKNNID